MKKFIMGLIVGVVMMLGTFAFADAPQIAATIRADFGVSLNGNAVKLAHDPIIVDGSMYLPLKDVAAIAGLNVSWNDNTSTAELSTKSVAPPQSNSGTVGVNDNGGTTKMTNIEVLTGYDPNYDAIKVDGVIYLPAIAAAKKMNLEFDFDTLTRYYTFKGTSIKFKLENNSNPGDDAFIYNGLSYIKEDILKNAETVVTSK